MKCWTTFCSTCFALAADAEHSIAEDAEHSTADASMLIAPAEVAVVTQQNKLKETSTHEVSEAVCLVAEQVDAVIAARREADGLVPLAEVGATV